MALQPKGLSTLTVGHGHAPPTFPAPLQVQCKHSSPAPSKVLYHQIIFTLDYRGTSPAHNPDKVSTRYLLSSHSTSRWQTSPENEIRAVLCSLMGRKITDFCFLTLVFFSPLWLYFSTGWSNYPQTSERVTYKSSSKPRARFLSGPVSLSICLYLLHILCSSLSSLASFVLSLPNDLATLLGLIFALFCVLIALIYSRAPPQA